MAISFAQLAILLLSPVVWEARAVILSSIFSQTLGTEKRKVLYEGKVTGGRFVKI
jgi:hypothetical protein